MWINGILCHNPAIATSDVSCLFVGGIHPQRYDAWVVSDRCHVVFSISDFKAHDYVISFKYTGYQTAPNLENHWRAMHMRVQFHAKKDFDFICKLIRDINPKFTPSVSNPMRLRELQRPT